jgi:hypothetical protein
MTEPAVEFDLGDLFFGSGVDGVAGSWRRWRARRARACPIAELPLGPRTKVTGVTRAIDPLRSPFTQTECVLWTVALVEDKKFAFRVVSSGHFWIADEAGDRVLVDPRDAMIALTPNVVTDHPSINRHNVELDAFLRHHGVLFDEKHHFYEAIIVADQRVSIWGRAWESAGAVNTGYRGGVTNAKVIGSRMGDCAVILAG